MVVPETLPDQLVQDREGRPCAHASPYGVMRLRFEIMHMCVHICAMHSHDHAHGVTKNMFMRMLAYVYGCGYMRMYIRLFV